MTKCHANKNLKITGPKNIQVFLDNILDIPEDKIANLKNLKLMTDLQCFNLYDKIFYYC